MHYMKDSQAVLGMGIGSVFWLYLASTWDPGPFALLAARVRDMKVAGHSCVKDQATCLTGSFPNTCLVGSVFERGVSWMT